MSTQQISLNEIKEKLTENIQDTEIVIQIIKMILEYAHLVKLHGVECLLEINNKQCNEISRLENELENEDDKPSLCPKDKLILDIIENLINTR